MLELLLGHILGDYFFQTQWMAENKYLRGWVGFWACFIHCFLYSLAVYCCVALMFPAIVVMVIAPIAFVGIFLSHWLIDRYSLAYKYMQFKGGPDKSSPFAPVVYVVIDNTVHVVLMYAFLKYALGIPV